MLKLSDFHSKSLLQQPESGMGYQFVEVTTTQGLHKKGIAINAELMSFDEEQSKLAKASYRSLLEFAEDSSRAIREVRVIPRSTSGASRYYQESQHVFLKASTGASGAAVEETKKDQVFKRFSAFENDKRISADGRLLPGSYATTEEDAKNVSTGKQAVARYALPNKEPAVNVFTIRPQEKTSIQYGIVQPANGEPGGGVEVLFKDGTTKNTVTGPSKIPAG